MSAGGTFVRSGSRALTELRYPILMRAGKAYLASAGTTGVLVAAAILLLVVVGALMAFDDEAQPDVLPPVPQVLLSPADKKAAQQASDAQRADRSGDDRAEPAGSGPPAGPSAPPAEPRGGDDGAPVVVTLPDSDVGDAPSGGGGNGAPAQGPGPAPAGTPEASQSPNPVQQVRDAVVGTVQDVATSLPRPSEVLEPAPEPLPLP